MPNILVTTFGSTWAILAEIISFCNYPCINILQNNNSIKSFRKQLKNNGIEKIDQLWVICTTGDSTKTAVKKFESWLNYFDRSLLPEIWYIGIKNLTDLTNAEECYQMTDLIFRTVLKASECKENGKLVLSLAGGRKTMSSDMQRASDIFGCDILFHIAGTDSPAGFSTPEDLKNVLGPEKANLVFPVLINANKDKNIITEVPTKLTSDDYKIELHTDNEPSTDLLDEINKRLQEAEYNHYHSYKNRTDNRKQSIFQGLLQLSPSKFSMLEKNHPDYDWIKKLPKADLHCHLGGVLDINGLIKVAHANEKEIIDYLDKHPEFARWHKTIRESVKDRKDEVLKEYIHNENRNFLRNLFPDIRKPITVAAFIDCFRNDQEYLEKLVYGKFSDPGNFRNIGFEQYEKLGDLQGTALLQSEESLRAVCEYIIEYCREHNLKYLELRCSPCNYTKGGLHESEVIKILYNNLFNNDTTKVRLIIIGSRHADEETLRKHINLTLECINNHKYKDFIAGFDIAGLEPKKSPGELRSLLIELMRECIRFTIHAGEDQPVENIWQAVYELNADRIGHGLTLVDKPDLMHRFRDRNIFIELCPSSNFQICNFDPDNYGKVYPLRKYIDDGLKITLNTDNPGISKTNISNEYMFAAEIANLTKLEVLNLIRNSVQGMFLPKDEKREMMVRFEDKLYTLL